MEIQDYFHAPNDFVLIYVSLILDEIYFPLSPIVNNSWERARAYFNKNIYRWLPKVGCRA